MPQINIVQAVNHALREEMRRDDRIVVLGEDVGKDGGVFRATEGLYDEFGAERVIDTPLAESGIIGTAIGMAIYGLNPVPEIQFLDFIYPAFDQIVTNLAKLRYRSGGQFSCHLVVRAPYGGGIKGGHYHSQSSEAYFCHTAGLKVVIPSTPYDTKGLLLSSMRDPDPVIFLEPKRIYRAVKGEVPDGEFTVPIGKARIAREGRDVTIFAYGAMLHVAMEAAESASKNGVQVEVVDLRTLVPLDIEAVLASVQKTGRVIILHEAPKTGGFGAEISALIAEKAIEYLKGPILRVTGYDTPFPYTLEEHYLPSAPKVLKAINKIMQY
ncbi:MAG: alpha-ketoacid dehydrogenase subunit beta [Nitrososphaerota archaeon]|nr:alpha-ketoacid dehydrogenase subunit beta [Nitrososphaerota archaeon]